MPKPKTRTNAGSIGIKIGGADGVHTKNILAILEKVAVAATANGREAVAIEAIRALSDIGSVDNVSISDTNIEMGR